MWGRFSLMGKAGSALSPLTSLQLQAQVATLSREVTRLQRQQERSPEKERASVPIKVRCPPVPDMSLRAWTRPDPAPCPPDRAHGLRD